jgi:hypothetical protein
MNRRPIRFVDRVFVFDESDEGDGTLGPFIAGRWRRGEEDLTRARVNRAAGRFEIERKGGALQRNRR